MPISEFPIYNAAEDSLTVWVSEERCTATQLTPYLHVFLGEKSRQLTGVKILGVTQALGNVATAAPLLSWARANNQQISEAISSILAPAIITTLKQVQQEFQDPVELTGSPRKKR